jgi:hypothetical protein
MIETENIFQALATFESSSYLTFARGGYIIYNNPMAIGRETVSSLMASRTLAISGSPSSHPNRHCKKYPKSEEPA